MLDTLADSAMNNAGARVRMDPAHYASYHNNQLMGSQAAATSMAAQRQPAAERSLAGVDTGSRPCSSNKDRMQGPWCRAQDAGHRMQMRCSSENDVAGAVGCWKEAAQIELHRGSRFKKVMDRPINADQAKVKSEMQQLNDRASPPSFEH